MGLHQQYVCDRCGKTDTDPTGWTRVRVRWEVATHDGTGRALPDSGSPVWLCPPCWATVYETAPARIQALVTGKGA